MFLQVIDFYHFLDKKREESRLNRKLKLQFRNEFETLNVTTYIGFSCTYKNRKL